MPAKASNNEAITAPSINHNQDTAQRHTPPPPPPPPPPLAYTGHISHAMIRAGKEIKWTIHYPDAPQVRTPVKKVGWAGGSRKKRRQSGIQTPLSANNECFTGAHFNLANVVKPTGLWESMKDYKSFMKTTEYIKVGLPIFINKDESIGYGADCSNLEPGAFWLGNVAEIRAIDKEHVFLRIHWYYWPEELPGGRQPWHGKNELLLSNHAEIIDAQTVSGKAKIEFWDEKPLTKGDTMEKLYWRGKYHCHLKAYSAPNKYCICKQPINPDVPLNIPCSNGVCRTWNHGDCVVEAAARRYFEQEYGPIETCDFTTEVWMDRFAVRLKYEAGKEPKIVIRDYRHPARTDSGMDDLQYDDRKKPEGRKEVKRVACLVCDEIIHAIQSVEEVEMESGKTTFTLSELTGAELEAAEGADNEAEMREEISHGQVTQIGGDQEMADADVADDHGDH